MVADLRRELLRLLATAMQDNVVQVHRIRHRQQVARFHLQRERLVVVIQVSGVSEPRLGREIECIGRVHDRRAEPARLLAPGQPAMNIPGLKHLRQLFFRCQVQVVAGVVDAVRHQLPAATFHRLQDRRIMLDYRHRQADGAANPERIDGVEQPPQPDPVAIVALRVTQHVRPRRPRPGFAGAHEFRLVLVMLDIRHNPQRYSRAVRPTQLRTVQNGRIGKQIGFHVRLLQAFRLC